MTDILDMLRHHAALHGAAGAPAAALAETIAAQRQAGARLDDIALFALVRKCAEAMGGQRPLARAIGISDSQLSDMLHSRRGAPERVLAAFGLAPVTVYAFARKPAAPAAPARLAEAPHGPGPRDFDAIMARLAATRAAVAAAAVPA